MSNQPSNLRLIDRLRDPTEADGYGEDMDIRREAATEIERLRAALETARLRFEYIAAGVGRPTVDSAAGARECAEALASHERETRLNDAP